LASMINLLQPAAGGLCRSSFSSTMSSPCFGVRRASLMVLPLRQGAGTRIKILETMAMGLTTVSTRLGAEGLPVVDGDNIVFAETAKNFADRVLDLLVHPQLNRHIGENARRFVRTFGWAAAAEAFECFC